MEEEKVKETFKRIIEKEPYDYQERAFREILNLSDSGGLALIEAPTASGKTEAVVFPYLTQHDIKSFPLARRLIYVLPTRALVNAQALRIKGYAQKLGLNLVVNIDHGAVQSPTPMFYGDVVLTTWDAFLYGYAAQRTIGTRLTIPAGNLALSMLVFDEVQMYQDWDFYTPRLMGSILNHFKGPGIPIVFMTATLPARLKEMLGLGEAVLISSLSSDAKKPLRGTVHVEIEKEKDILDVIAKNRTTLEETIKRQEKVLIVTNTVKKAVEVWEKVKEIDSEAILLHSRLVNQARREREQQLINGHFKVLVATQLVESGLDIPKITLGIVEAAPPDALIQRIGRVARRESEHGQVLVVIPRENGKVHFRPYLSVSEDDLKGLKAEIEKLDAKIKKLKEKNEKADKIKKQHKELTRQREELKRIYKKFYTLENFWADLNRDSVSEALNNLEACRKLLDNFYDQFIVEEEENGEEKAE
ncbi:MAG TPA: CRISPR-associated helicase Cas3' [Candidatus Limnocylindrales bacterium]|nr:CRISPR-associated helicase Cas3' [Candidatus Limnocylindrales bacterium]